MCHYHKYVSMLTKIGSEGTKKSKGQHGSPIPTSVSVPFKSSKLSQSVMKLGKQRDKKAISRKGGQKSFQNGKFLMFLTHFLTENLELQNMYPLVMRAKVINIAM